MLQTIYKSDLVRCQESTYNSPSHATGSQKWKIEDLRVSQWMSYVSLIKLCQRVCERVNITDIGQLSKKEVEMVREELEKNG